MAIVQTIPYIVDSTSGQKYSITEEKVRWRESAFGRKQTLRICWMGGGIQVSKVFVVGIGAWSLPFINRNNKSFCHL
jgi:hypothetical protein